MIKIWCVSNLHTRKYWRKNKKISNIAFSTKWWSHRLCSLKLHKLIKFIYTNWLPCWPLSNAVYQIPVIPTSAHRRMKYTMILIILSSIRLAFMKYGYICTCKRASQLKMYLFCMVNQWYCIIRVVCWSTLDISSGLMHNNTALKKSRKLFPSSTDSYLFLLLLVVFIFSGYTMLCSSICVCKWLFNHFRPFKWLVV